MILKRKPPAAVRKELRQEAGFGCAVCGNPIVEYHHIIAWEEEKHHNPDHMVALCPSHHTELGKLSQANSYRAKQNPINIRKKRIRGYLGGNRNQKALRVGGAIATNGATAISYSGAPIFSYKLVEGEYHLDCFLPKPDFWPEIEVRDNTISAWTDDFWDIEFKTNWVKFNRNRKSVFLTIDFRKDQVEIEGEFEIGGTDVSVSADKIVIDTNVLIGVEANGQTTAVGFGPRGRLQRPNFAMLDPKSVLFPTPSR